MSEPDKDVNALKSLLYQKFSAGLNLSEELSQLRKLLKARFAAADAAVRRRASALPGNVVPPPATRPAPGPAPLDRAPNQNPKKRYFIQWKCAISGKVGMSTIPLGQAEADRLAAELNRDIPGLQYEAVFPGTAD